MKHIDTYVPIIINKSTFEGKSLAAVDNADAGSADPYMTVLAFTPGRLQFLHSIFIDAFGALVSSGSYMFLILVVTY